jgi:hypothetical protein
MTDINAVEPLRQTNNTAYAEAIKLVLKVARLMKAQDQSRQFVSTIWLNCACSSKRSGIS